VQRSDATVCASPLTFSSNAAAPTVPVAVIVTDAPDWMEAITESTRAIVSRVHTMLLMPVASVVLVESPSTPSLSPTTHRTFARETGLPFRSKTCTTTGNAIGVPAGAVCPFVAASAIIAAAGCVPVPDKSLLHAASAAARPNAVASCRGKNRGKTFVMPGSYGVNAAGVGAAARAISPLVDSQWRTRVKRATPVNGSPTAIDVPATLPTRELILKMDVASEPISSSRVAGRDAY
jgi:hypothetical protein